MDKFRTFHWWLNLENSVNVEEALCFPAFVFLPLFNGSLFRFDKPLGEIPETINKDYRMLMITKQEENKETREKE